MPLFLSIILQDSIELQIWKVSEDQSFFAKNQEWYERESSWIDSIHPKRRMDYLASRYILYNRLKPKTKLPIIKDEFGKLRFQDDEHFLSISHTGPYASFVMGPRELGLDIQMYDKKILNILSKYLSQNEKNLVESIEDLNLRVKLGTLCWCAKEAIYKAHGKRGIQFNSQIELQLEFNQLRSGRLYLQDQIIEYNFTYELEEEFAWLVAYHSEHLDDISSDFM